MFSKDPQEYCFTRVRIIFDVSHGIWEPPNLRLQCVISYDKASRVTYLNIHLDTNFSRVQKEFDVFWSILKKVVHGA